MSPRLLEDLHLALASAESRIIRVLAALAATLVAAHLAFVAFVAALGRERIHQLGLLSALDQLNLDAEQNLPTYFSCAMLAFAGGLLLMTARRVRAAGAPMARHWLALSAIFFLMSFDEFSSLHERFGEFLHLHFHAPGSGALHFTWVVFGLPFVAIVGSVYLPFLLALPRLTRNAMLLAGIVYVCGVLGMELLDGWYMENHGENTVYLLLTMVEEGLEMAGVILFIRSLLRVASELPRIGQAQKKPTGESLHPWAWTR